MNILNIENNPTNMLQDGIEMMLTVIRNLN